MAVIHINARKRVGKDAGRHRGGNPPRGSAEKVTEHDPVKAAAALLVEYATMRAALGGYLISDDYAADLLTLFGEELRLQADMAVSVLEDPWVSFEIVRSDT